MTDQSSPNPISPVGYSIDAGQTQLPPHLLIVEDDAGTQKLLQHLLGSDYRLTISQNGEEALELLRQYTFDLVLLDLRMPRVDGFEVLRVLRQRVNALHTPVIVTSAVTERDIIVRALSMGANDYVNKPIDLDILNARIQTQLALKKLMLTQEAKTETIAMTRDLQRQLSRIISHDIQSPLTNFRLGHFMLRDLIGGAEGPGEMAYRHGASLVCDALLLRGAVFEADLPDLWQQAVAEGAAAQFPLTAADLMPGLQGPALGARLAELEAAWIASGFSLSRADMLG